MEASAANAGRLPGEVRLARKPWYDVRPYAVVVIYLALFSVLSLGVRFLGGSSALNHVHLPAGLSIGLLLLYGLGYAPVVLLACLADSLWLHPVAGPFPLIALICLLQTGILASGAGILRRLCSGPQVSLKYGRDVAKFMAAAMLISIGLALVTVGGALFQGSLQWLNAHASLVADVIGFATGILTITPFLLIHAGPRLEELLLEFSGERPASAQYLRGRWMDNPATVFVLSIVGLLGIIFWLMLGQGMSQIPHVFLLLSLPLIWVALQRGLEGLSIVVPVLAAITMIAFSRYASAAAASGSLQLIMLIAFFNAYMIGSGVTQLRVTDLQLVRRDAIIDAVAYAAQEFEGKGGWEGGVQEVMRRLGEATSVTRVFITDKRTSEKSDKSESTWQYEWTMPGLVTEQNDRRMLNLLREQLIEDHANVFAAGQSTLFFTKNMDHTKREMLEALGVRSMVIVPMFVDRQWWGCLGLEQCFVDRDWPASERDGLKMAAQILGTLIASVRVELQFRQLTGNIQAVFWISSPDGYAKQYVSPGYEEVWGRSCSNLQRAPRSWLEAIHSEDQPRVCEALIKLAWGEYDEEYRVVRPDLSVRWVRDRAFPVRDKAGQVYRIVGIAEDITKQKKTEQQLRTATTMLSSLIDHLQSGVVVEDDNRHIMHVNQAFNDMFAVPVPPVALFGVDSRLLYLQPPTFAERIEQVIQSRTPILGEELQWQDRIFIRNYVPLSVGEDHHYHLWQYQDITDGRRAEEQIKSSLKEKEVLLKEIHHRVKNNLQIICSLLSLQASESRDDPKAEQVLKESQNRIKAMALIHERFYQSRDLAKIDFEGYVRNLTGHLLKSYKGSSAAIRLNLDVQPVPMNFDVAIPCGLIINELVSNSLKYAFPKDNGKFSAGDIWIRFADENNQTLRLTIRDNGVGFPEDADPEDSESLGLKLVKSLTEQLGGSIYYTYSSGFQTDIIIPKHRV